MSGLAISGSLIYTTTMRSARGSGMAVMSMLESGNLMRRMHIYIYYICIDRQIDREIDREMQKRGVVGFPRGALHGVKS